MDDTEIMEADIHEKINSTLSLLTHRIKNKIQITKDYDDRIGMIKCYPGPLNQVFMNLLNNAIDAIDEKANQNSAHGVQPRQPYQIKISTNLHETTLTKHVKIVISDNGTGLPEEIRDKLFDPFFTTKEVGKGTGLGLSICHGIIEKHKGSISFDSRVGEGTDFIIILPLE
jgi:signal transduction histidine kinase